MASNVPTDIFSAKPIKSHLERRSHTTFSTSFRWSTVSISSPVKHKTIGNKSDDLNWQQTDDLKTDNIYIRNALTTVSPLEQLLLSYEYKAKKIDHNFNVHQVEKSDKQLFCRECHISFMPWIYYSATSRVLEAAKQTCRLTLLSNRQLWPWAPISIM